MDTNDLPQAREARIYLPTWLSDEEYERLRALSFERFDHVILAFALPAKGAALKMPEISRPLGGLLGWLGEGGVDIHLAIGGLGDGDREHEQMLEHWRQAADEPHRFAERVRDAIGGLERKLQITMAGVDLDWEYPTQKDAFRFAALATQIREHLGDRSLSVAVPAGGEDLRGYETAMAQLLPVVDLWHVMTYDRTGPWNEMADHHAPGVWTLECARKWVERVGAERVSIGFPAYGYEFTGVTGPGQRSGGEVRPVMVSGLDLSQASEDWEQLASGLLTDNGWVTFQSPAMIRTVRDKLAEMGVTQTFTWSAEGLSPVYVGALTD